MEMDLQLSLIAIGVACATAVAVYIVSVIGIKEKSFEEAIAEQKKRSDDLLGSHHHGARKKKVQGSKESGKGASKKLKRKEQKGNVNNNVVQEAGRVADLSDVDNSGEVVQEVVEKVGKKNHVEIVDEPEIMEDIEEEAERRGEDGENSTGLAVPQAGRASSRRSSVSNPNAGRRDSIIKPILLNKDEVTLVSSSKHDVEPANHFEQIHPKDDCELRQQRQAANNIAEDQQDASTPPSPKQAKSGSSGTNTPVLETESGSTNNLDSPHGVRGGGGRSNARGNNKSSKKVADDEVPGAPKIEKLIDKCALSSSEIQNLIDVLLNKQHAGDSEWINKTKSDNSVAGLKKQIEVKDKMISEEQAAVSTLQAKLKELRNEFTSEKNKFAGVRRQLEEQANQKGLEVQSLQLSLKKYGEIGMNEKKEMQKQVAMAQFEIKKVQDENEAIKADYRNYREAEASVRAKADSLEREREALKTSCGHLENQLRNAFASNEEMSKQLRGVQDLLRVTEERKKESEVAFNNEYRKVQDREGGLLAEIKSFKSSLAAVEQENIKLRGQVSVLEGSVKSIDDVTHKYEELRNAEVGLRNVVNELKGEVGRLQDEVKARDLRVAVLETEVKAAAENEQVKGDKVNGEVEAAATRVKQLSEELAGKEVEVEKLVGRVKELDNQVGGYGKELKSARDEVEERKLKNDELRHKNQKLLESLTVTEQSLQTRIEAEEKLKRGLKETDERVKAVVVQILGDEKLDSGDDWLLCALRRVHENQKKAAAAPPPRVVEEKGESVTEKQLEELASEKKVLQDEVTHYQGMLKQTETLLSNLQASINAEETNWAAQTAEKDKEIERLSADVRETDSLRKLVEEHQAARKELEDKFARGDSSSEELVRTNASLRADLESAQRTCEQLKAQLAEASSSPQASVNGSEQSSNNNSSSSAKTSTASPPVSPSAVPPQGTVPGTPPSPLSIKSMTSSSNSPPPKEKKKRKGSSKK